MDRPLRATRALAHADEPTEELVARLDRLLHAGVHGLCFSAYLPGQGPALKTQLGREQIRERLEIVRPHVGWVRSFSCTDGNELVPGIARAMGLRTLAGAWIGDDPATNEREIAAAIALARRGDADLLAIGNEVLLRGEMSADQIVALLQRVRREVHGVPIGYVDAYYLFDEHPALVDACDVLLINCYPFWEKCALEDSIAYFQEMVARVERVAKGKPIAISETGWPSAGEPVGAAIPSERNALLYALNTLEWTASRGLPLFYFSAFDEQWKEGPEGGCGPHWGFWDQAGRPKFGLSPGRGPRSGGTT